MKRTESDARVVEQCLEGDTRAFATLVDRYQKVLYNVALRIVRDPDDAADIAQTVFVKAYEKLDQYDPAHKFYSWIYRMTVNASLNFAQRSRRTGRLDDEELLATSTPADEYARGETGRRIEDAMFQLSPEDRALISLKYSAELSYFDLAYVFEIPEKTVKSRLYTARQRLKEYLISLGVDERNGA